MPPKATLEEQARHHCPAQCPCEAFAWHWQVPTLSQRPLAQAEVQRATRSAVAVALLESKTAHEAPAKPEAQVLQWGAVAVGTAAAALELVAQKPRAALLSQTQR